MNQLANNEANSHRNEKSSSKETMSGLYSANEQSEVKIPEVTQAIEMEIKAVNHDKKVNIFIIISFVSFASMTSQPMSGSLSGWAFAMLTRTCLIKCAPYHEFHAKSN